LVWILLATLVVSIAFFLMVFRQVSRTEERLRKLVVQTESRISRKYGAKLVPPGKGETQEDEE
jgi:hypothetical protein